MGILLAKKENLDTLHNAMMKTDYARYWFGDKAYEATHGPLTPDDVEKVQEAVRRMREQLDVKLS